MSESWLLGRDEIRAALREWVFGDRLTKTKLPAKHASAVDWLDAHTVSLSAFNDGYTAWPHPKVLNRLGVELDGTAATANTYRRKHAIAYHAFRYAKERKYLSNHPFDAITKVNRRKKTNRVDPEPLPNPDQQDRLFTAIEAQGALGQRLVAFCACMRYAALRPEECTDLEDHHLADLPQPGSDHIGEFRLTSASPVVGRRWSDNGNAKQERPLKHRDEGDTRHPPIVPELAEHLHHHQRYYRAPGIKRIFTGPMGGIIHANIVDGVWRRAREVALTDDERARGIAATPYSLRKACLADWIKRGIDPSQIAEWAGHSIDTLFAYYAKCFDQGAEVAKQKLRDTSCRTTSKNEHIDNTDGPQLALLGPWDKYGTDPSDTAVDTRTTFDTTFENP